MTYADHRFNSPLPATSNPRKCETCDVIESEHSPYSPIAAASAALEYIPTTKLAAAGFTDEATAIGTARRALDKALAELRALDNPLPVAESLKCPHCQYAGEEETDNGGTFRYLANVTAWREIVKVRRSRRKTKPQTIIVDGLSHTYDEDEETNDRIECRKCLGEFLLAKTIEVEFV